MAGKQQACRQAAGRKAAGRQQEGSGQAASWQAGRQAAGRQQAGRKAACRQVNKVEPEAGKVVEAAKEQSAINFLRHGYYKRWILYVSDYGRFGVTPIEFLFNIKMCSSTTSRR